MTELNYLTFWGRERPIFLDTPKEKDLFFPERYQRGLERMRFALKFGTGLVTVAMPSGHGTSTLARKIFQELAIATHEVALLALFQKQEKAGWLLPKLALQFGFPPQVDSLLKFYDEVKEEQRILSVLVDDARKMSHVDALDDLSGLFSLASSALLPVGAVLFGFDPSLISMSQSNLSVAHQAHISFGAYDVDETKAYVEQRLLAAAIDPGLVAAEFWPLLTQASQGILARINRIMEGCMMLAAEANLRRVTPTMLEVWLEEQGLRVADAPVEAKLVIPSAQNDTPVVMGKGETSPAEPVQNETKKESEEPRQKPVDLRSLFLDETGS